MSKMIYVECKNGDTPDAILCEACETFFEDESADQHIENEPTHLVTPLRLEVA